MENSKAVVVDRILEEYYTEHASIITVLQEIQKEYRYLPEDTLEYLAKKADISPAKIFGIATFYENFSLEPKGKYVIKICDGTACHVRKSIPVLEALRKSLNLSSDKTTTDDLMFTVETVSCLGACGLAPAICVNDKIYGKMTPESSVELLEQLKKEETHEN